MRQAGIDVGRDQVARLMKALEIEGARREKRVKTTQPDPAATRHPDLVNRVFSADAPNRLRVTELTFVPTWQGVAYVGFIVDVFDRAIVGGDSYDNSLVESVNGYYKAELVRGPAKKGPWKTLNELELATLGWVRAGAAR